jgi:hypothetical protein
MSLYLLGIRHWDPLGRDRLIKALRALQKCHSEPPYFVAVEYDSQEFDRLRRQRSLFRNELSKKEPRLSEEELNVYELSLAYEGDAHQDLFPDSKTVWLDEGRNAKIEDMDKRLLGWYVGICDKLGVSLAGSLEKISHDIGSEEDDSIEDPGRDKKFAEVVKSELNQKKEWAIVIVGRAHTNSKTQGSMANLLMRDGVQFDMLDLCRPGNLCVSSGC